MKTAQHHSLDAEVAASRLHWWGTPRYRDQIAIGDLVWLQVTGPGESFQLEIEEKCRYLATLEMLFVVSGT